MNRAQRAALIITRISFGILFLQAGLMKLLSDFSATDYLLASTYGPFATTFQSLANSNVTDFLVIFGEISIGIALLLGIFTKFTAVAGSLMMLLFYLSAFPPKTGIVSMHIMYILIFCYLALNDAGAHLGLNIELKNVIQALKNARLSKNVPSSDQENSHAPKQM